MTGDGVFRYGCKYSNTGYFENKYTMKFTGQQVGSGTPLNLKGTVSVTDSKGNTVDWDWDVAITTGSDGQYIGLYIGYDPNTYRSWAAGTIKPVQK